VGKARRFAIYLRVSTTGQTVENQKHELEEAGHRHGWEVVRFFKDAGYSGARGRDQRPGLDALLRGVARKEFDLGGGMVRRSARALVAGLARLIG
jgi:DNA invertase Pin-like site-specific DNA recombinase